MRTVPADFLDITPGYDENIGHGYKYTSKIAENPFHQKEFYNEYYPEHVRIHISADILPLCIKDTGA